MINEIKATVNFLQEKGITNPEVGIILGTGLGNLAEEIEVEVEIPYTEIPGFPEATVEFHAGKLIYGSIAGRKVVAMKGRFHFYEGYSMQQIIFPVRVLKLLGIQSLLISNAAGAMNLDWKKGELMLITDHINKFPDHALHGANIEELGTRFPDMSEAYNKGFRSALRQIANRENITLHEGVYITAQGPMLETAAEYRYLKIAGGDAVGMSTVPEVIAANHMGLPVAAISVLTDECDPDNLQPVDIEDIIEVAGKAEKKLTTLFVGLIKGMK
ncbi:MAG: purine-nucleoside phosphorylase [Flavobacteriales bacterium]|nr:purine-nucleoside phosphorylase [Flavobacteriales bacterium]